METLNKNGVSITQTSGEEKYVKCCLGAFRGQIYYQYDWKIQCKLPPKTKRFCPLKTFNNAPL
ncbi:DUF3873 family protein, partial [Bacteroides uniformis]|uniref:DUF3873 family protein n=1 Tax=Bacteroides uniformis TaxID=820 RepID=UPI00356326E2